MKNISIFKEGIHFAGTFNQLPLSELINLGEPTFISKSQSKYWEIGNNIYRLSNHWGSVGRSFFNIKGKINAPKKIKLGVIRISKLDEIVYLDIRESVLLKEISSIGYDIKMSIKSHVLSSKIEESTIIKHSSIQGIKNIKINFKTIAGLNIIKKGNYFSEPYYKKTNQKTVYNYINSKLIDFKANILYFKENNKYEKYV